MPNSTARLRIENFGPIVEAEVEFGDLTVFVGPQATGKSLFLQVFKLLQDRGFIWKRFKDAGLVWTEQVGELLDLYLGEGMGSAYSPRETYILENGRAVELGKSLEGASKVKTKEEQVFYIPAQRVMCISRGLPLRFVDFQAGDPFVLRQFSETIYQNARHLHPHPRWHQFYTNRCTKVHKKRQLTTPSCRFPLRAGGTKGLGSPREAGGTYGGGSCEL